MLGCEDRPDEQGIETPRLDHYLLDNRRCCEDRPDEQGIETTAWL